MTAPNTLATCWLRQFAQALDMPEVWDDIAGLL